MGIDDSTFTPVPPFAIAVIVNWKTILIVISSILLTMSIVGTIIWSILFFKIHRGMYTTLTIMNSINHKVHAVQVIADIYIQIPSLGVQS